MWGLLLTVLAIWPYAMTSSFHIKKKYENILIAFMVTFPTPEWHMGRKVALNVTQWGKKRQGAHCSKLPAVVLACIQNGHQARAGKLHTLLSPTSHQENKPIKSFFYRISMSFLNQHSITSTQQRTGTDLVSEMWVQIPTLVLTNCELNKWSNPFRLPISLTEKLGYQCFPR